MNNPGPRLPEFNAILLCRTFQEVKHLLVGNNSVLYDRLDVFRASSSIVTSRSVCAPFDAWIRWSQCMLTGTAHRERPALMNCNLLIPISDLRELFH